MSNIKNPVTFWGGLVSLGAGIIVIYYAVDFYNTNLNTKVYPDLIRAGLEVLGFVLIGVGLVMMITGYFRKPKV